MSRVRVSHSVAVQSSPPPARTSTRSPTLKACFASCQVAPHAAAALLCSRASKSVRVASDPSASGCSASSPEPQPDPYSTLGGAQSPFGSLNTAAHSLTLKRMPWIKSPAAPPAPSNATTLPSGWSGSAANEGLVAAKRSTSDSVSVPHGCSGSPHGSVAAASLQCCETRRWRWRWRWWWWWWW